MAFHVTNLGSAGRKVAQYTDLGGYVPEMGDQPEDFDWGGAEHTPFDWDQWVADAAVATQEAQAAIDRRIALEGR